MKRVLLFIVLMVPAYIVNAVEAVKTSVSSIQKHENKSVFKGLLYKVWGRFKAISPKDDSKNKLTQRTITAGVRGAETTSSILQPYWKDDRSNDKQFIKQLQDFAHAQSLVDEGRLADANQAFNSFVEYYPGSDLRVNARFAIGLTLGGMGQNDECVQVFEGFVKEYPEHPLTIDAKTVIAEFK